jgi:hypothetical protein
VTSLVGTELFRRYEVDRENAEDAMSFHGIISTIVTRFYQNLSAALNDQKLADRVFREKSGADLADHFAGITRSLVRQVINNMDNPPSAWRDIEITLKSFVMERLG